MSHPELGVLRWCLLRMRRLCCRISHAPSNSVSLSMIESNGSTTWTSLGWPRPFRLGLDDWFATGFFYAGFLLAGLLVFFMRVFLMR